MLQNLIDRLAHWWIERRIDRAVQEFRKQPEYSEMELHKAHFDKNGWSVDLIHENIAILAANCAEMLNRANAENYVQFVIFPSAKAYIKPVEVTLRWYWGGMTPAEKNGKLEEENKRYLARIQELTEQCNTFYAKANELEAAKAFHPRAWKLISKGKPFVVIANDELYYPRAYNMIRGYETACGTWTEEDERIFQQALEAWSALQHKGEPS